MQNFITEHEHKLPVGTGRRGEPGHRPERLSQRRLAALEPGAVDAALEDDGTTPLSRGARHELASRSAFEESMHKLDEPHVPSSGERTVALPNDPVLRRLSEQLTQLRRQQEQISRLLEEADIGASLSC